MDTEVLILVNFDILLLVVQFYLQFLYWNRKEVFFSVVPNFVIND